MEEEEEEEEVEVEEEEMEEEEGGKIRRNKKWVRKEEEEKMKDWRDRYGKEENVRMMRTKSLGTLKRRNMRKRETFRRGEGGAKERGRILERVME